MLKHLKRNKNRRQKKKSGRDAFSRTRRRRLLIPGTRQIYIFLSLFVFFFFNIQSSNSTVEWHPNLVRAPIDRGITDLHFSVLYVHTPSHTGMPRAKRCSTAERRGVCYRRISRWRRPPGEGGRQRDLCIRCVLWYMPYAL